MKQKLTLLILALLTSMGAWAGTPTTDAYPVPGKTYYLYAIQKDGSRSYLYNDEGTLKVSNGSKENTNAYKWTVTKSGNYYYIANVAGNKLCTSNASGNWGLSLNSDGQTFDLSSTVSDGACVSMKSGIYWWVAPKASGSWPASNYYISSHGTNDDYSPNYIFEEVLTSHSLTNGAYYRIYCDNDSKQYLYDNGTALAVGSTSINANYAWKCIVNGDYYNLQNMETEKYMGWQNVQNAAYDLIVGTGDPDSRGCQAKSIGMATIYGPKANLGTDGRFLVMGYDNSFSQSTITYEKGSTNYSADFRFVRVKKVTFSSAVAVNGGDAVSTIYVATDGSESITLPANYKYTIAGVEKNGLQAATTIAAAGTSDISVTVSSPILVSDKKYRIQQAWQSNRWYLYANTSDGSNGDRLWKKNNPSSTTVLTDGNYIWQAKTSSSNWKLFNPAADEGNGRYIAKAPDANKDGSDVKALNASSADGAESFTLISAESCGYPPSDYSTSCYVALKETTYGTRYLNSYSSENSYVGWFNAAHAGYYFKFIPVKTVTFSTAVAVDGGSAVSTIYVATDGSDSFTLPIEYKYTISGVTYYAAVAAEVIAAAGTSDISVTVASTKITSTSQLSNNKKYIIRTASKGSFYAAEDATALNSTTKAGVTVDTTSPAQQFAFVYYDADGEGGEDGKYYLYSVGEKKFVRKNGSYTSLANTASNAVTLVTSESATYPVVVSFVDGETYNHISVSNGYTPGIISFYNSTSGDGNQVQVIEVADFNAADALDRFSTSDVVFKVKWGNDIIKTSAAQSVDRGFATLPSGIDPCEGFMSYTYEPETITSSTTEVVATATWNGPFQYAATFNASTAKWYTVGIHSAYEGANHIWKYDGSQYVVTEAVATDAYGSITNDHLFCFVGDPYSGFSIYNKTVGDTKTLYKSADTSNKAEMAAEGSLFVPNASIESGKTPSAGYGCFLIKDGSIRLNADAGASFIIKGWGDSGNGSTCWFYPEGRYYLTYLNSLLLTPPAGSVGTKAGITDEDVRAELIATKTALDANVFYLDTDKTAVEKATFKTTLNAIKNSETIALGAGYYRIVNADPRFVTSQSKRPAIYYNGTDNLQWSINGLTADYQVNSIFKLEGSGTTYTMKSPNAVKYVQTSATSGQSEATGKLGDSGADVTFTLLGSAQYNLKVASDAQSIHANGHSSGAGAGSNLVQYNGGTDSPSAWYIVKVDGLDIPLNGPVDGNYYATMCLPFDVTLASACAYTLNLNGAKDGLTLSEAMSEVPAGTPVLLRHTANSIKASIASDASTGAPLTSTDLTGVYVDTPVAADTDVDGTADYFLGIVDSKIGFYHWAGTTLKANRAYFDSSDLSVTVKGFVLDFEDDPDGIATIENSTLNIEHSDGAIYNLAGQRLNKMQKGINIVNGKKILK